MFCPFVKGECVSDCIFNNNCGNPGDYINCNFADAIDTIRSLQAPKSHIDNRLVEIIGKLSDVESSASYSDTDISSIRSDVSDIARKIND